MTPPQSRTSYRFTHESVVEAPRDRVQAVLVDLEHYPSWWREVRAVLKIDDDNAVVVVRSVLPYDLELYLRAVTREPDLLEVAIDGALRGWSRWRLHDEDGSRTRLAYEQEVTVEAPLLRLGSWLARPLLTWNHARMMRGAEEGLRRELRRASRPG